ncbi:MAG: NADH-quinone oxidoreductase subunit NuoH [Ktedonobacterales bacterium]
MTFISFLVTLVTCAIVIVALATAMAYSTLLERRVLARIQLRPGPNRVGPGGFLQPLADLVKLLLKEDIVPSQADSFIFKLAPMISLVVAFMAFAVIPFGPSDLKIGDVAIPFRVTDLNIGILYIFAMTSLGVYGIVLAGWSSNNKYSLLGGVRSSAQVISYELAMGMAVVGVVMLTGSLRMGDIVHHQDIWPLGWNAFRQPLGFVLYVIASIAEVNRAPFDLPEAEQELVAGYHIEYSSMRFAMFFMAEYINMVTISAIATTLFLGGWLGPVLPGVLWFVLKLSLFMFLMMWLRATLPRMRYDRLMNFGWRILLPLALANIIVTAVMIVVFPNA